LFIIADFQVVNSLLDKQKPGIASCFLVHNMTDFSGHTLRFPFNQKIWDGGK